MPKAGNFEYPTRDLDDCVRYISEAHEIAKIFVMQRESFAKNIGMSFKGGAFGLLVGSIAQYGLVETGAGDIRYTDLAQKILFGQPKEIEDSKNQAVRNVRLFAEIFDRYGDNPTQEQIRHILREKAGISVAEEAKIAPEIGKLFKNNAHHLKARGGEQRGMTKTQTLQEFSGSGLFTITAQGLTIEVDNLMKLGLVEKMIEDARKKLTENDSNSVKGKKNGDDHEPEYA